MATLIPLIFRRRSALVALLLAALILAACGSGSAAPAGEAAAGAGEQSEAEAEGAQAEAAVEEGEDEADAAVQSGAPGEEEEEASEEQPPAPAVERAAEPEEGDAAPADDEETSTTAPPAANAPDSAIVPPEPYDNDNALRILEALTVTIGPRVQGTQGERDAAAFLAAEFEAAGYVVELQPVPLESRQVAEQSLRVEGEPIGGEVFDGSAGGEVRGPLVVVPGLGASSDFTQVDVEGAIVLVERGVLFFRDKIANAAAAGAIGIVIYNNEPGAFSGALGAPATLPALAITQEDGLALRARAGDEAPEAELLVRFDPRSGESVNVVARAPEAACTVWVGGHFDTVPGVAGANDNGSGTALVVELARAYAGTETGRQACFVAFGAEEGVGQSTGILGSRIFVQSLVASGAIGEVTAMLNLDVAAIGGTLVLVGDGPLVTLAEEVGEALAIDVRPGSLPIGSGSDHLNFAQAGVPVIFPTLLGGPIHVPGDNFDATQPDRLAAVGGLAHGLLGCLTGADCVLAAS